MSSSLSRQLAAVRTLTYTPSQSGIGLKTRTSLLFEKHEAADYDRKTIYQLGLSGFQELIDNGVQDLEVFRESLFSPSVAEVERHMLDEEANLKFDEAIDGLLVVLTRHMLTRSAHKILEYLIRQFVVHIHNVERLLQAAISYHDTEFFVKLVNLPVSVKDTKWVFLESMRKRKRPLSRENLVKICTSQTQVLNSIFEMVKLQPSNNQLISFFVVLSGQVVEYAGNLTSRGSNKLEEEIVPILARAALYSMRESEFPELQRAGYFVVAQLAKHSSLSEKAKDLFLLTCTRKATSQTLSDGLRCASIVSYHSSLGSFQQNQLPWKSVSKLVSRFKDVNIVAASFADAFTAQPTTKSDVRFVSEVYRQLAESGKPECISALQEYVTHCTPPKVAPLFQLLGAQHGKDTTEETTKKVLENIGRYFATTHPDDIDAVVEDSSCDLAKFATACFHGSKKLLASCPLQDSNGTTTLRLALLHPTAKVREEALKELLKLDATLDDIDLNTLLARVQDDAPEVSLAALDLCIRTFSKLDKDSALSIDEHQIVSAAAFALSSSPQVSEGVLKWLGCVQFQQEESFSDALLLVIGQFPMDKDDGEKSPLSAAVSLCKANKDRKMSVLFRDKSSVKKFSSKGAREALIETLCPRALHSGSPRVCAVLLHLLVSSKVGNDDVETAMGLATNPKLWEGDHNGDYEDSIAKCLGILIRTTSTKGLVILRSLLNSPNRCFTFITTTLQTLFSEQLRDSVLISLGLIASGAVANVSVVGQRRALLLATSLIRGGASSLCFLEFLPFVVYGLTRANDDVNTAAIDCSVAILESCKSKTQYLDYKFPKRKLDKKTRETLALKGQPDHFPSSDGMQALVEQICQSRVSSSSVGETKDFLPRLLRNTNKNDAVLSSLNVILHRAALFMQVFTDWTLVEMETMLENILRPLLGHFKRSKQDATYDIARLALGQGFEGIVNLVVGTCWVREDFIPGKEHIDLLLGIVSKGGSVEVVHLLSSEKFYYKLKKNEKLVLLRATCESIKKNTGRLMPGDVPFEGKLLAEYIGDDDVVLDICRARLYGETNTLRKQELCQGLAPPLATLLKSNKDEDRVMICLTRCMEIVFEIQKESLTKSFSRHLDVPTVVEKAQSATVASTRNNALRLLLACTKLYPDSALESSLPILENLAFSPSCLMVLGLITRCIAASGSSSSSSMLFKVLAKFVEVSSESSDTSRLLDLYESLAQSSGVTRSLWLVSLFILRQQDSHNAEHQAWLVEQLLSRFKVEDQVFSIVQMVKALRGLAEERDDVDDDDEEHDDELVDIFCTEYNKKDDGYFDFGLMLCEYLSAHLSSPLFLRQLHHVRKQNDEKPTTNQFFDLLKHLHRHIHFCGKRIAECSDEEQVRYVEMRQTLCTVLDKIGSLLSVTMFVAVIQELLGNEDPYVRQLALKQLAEKVENQRSTFTREDVIIFLDMVNKLSGVITNSGTSAMTDDDDEEELVVNKQTALLTIDVLGRTLVGGSETPLDFQMESFLRVVESVICLLEEEENSDQDLQPALQLKSSACLCLSTLITILKTKTIRYLPRFGKELFKCYSQYSAAEESTDVANARLMLAQSAASAIHSMVANLAKFVSPYLVHLFTLVGRGGQLQSDNKRSLMQVTSERVGKRLAKEMEPRLLLHPLELSFFQFVADGQFVQASRLVDLVLTGCIEEMDRAMLSAQFDTLKQFFIKSLNVRSFSASEDLEECLAECVISLVLKLSGSQMRSLFHALCGALHGEEYVLSEGKHDIFQLDEDLSSPSSTKKRKKVRDVVAVEDRVSKAQTLYLYTSRLADRLLSLSGPYLSLLVEDVVSDLNVDFGEEKEEDHEVKPRKKKKKDTNDSDCCSNKKQELMILRKRGLMVLELYCEHGRASNLIKLGESDGIKEFGSLLDAILRFVDIDLFWDTQTDEEALGKCFMSFVQEHVVPCIVKLAQSTGDDAMWQTLHHAVLEYSTHASKFVRVAMLEMVVALFEQVGESYIVLLADTMQTISELLEDKEVDVKRAANKAVQKLQQLSGQDLEGYLE